MPKPSHPAEPLLAFGLFLTVYALVQWEHGRRLRDLLVGGLGVVLLVWGIAKARRVPAGGRRHFRWKSRGR